MIFINEINKVIKRNYDLFFGANDYLTKPFHLDELVARVNIQLRNGLGSGNKNYIEFDDIKLNINNS